MASSYRRALSVVVSILLVLAMSLPARAQIPGLPDLPDAPSGAIGMILDPLEELLESVTGPLGDVLGDIPLDNAVTITADDAVDAAIALSRITFETSAIALVGRDDVFADSLSSVASQGIAGAPLLLTPSDSLDERVVEELDRLGTTQVIVLGSTDAISEGLEEDLVDRFGDANVARVGGPSRVETAALLADYVAPDATDAILLRAYPEEGADQSQAYADALAAGPLGSMKEWPALLTTTDYLHPAAREYFEEAEVTNVAIVGGEAAVGPEVESELTDMGITVTRIAGENRWGTAIEIARSMDFLDAADASRLILSEAGAVEEPLWAAGFAAAAHGAVFEAPVILADGVLLPPETLAFLGDGLISNALRLSNLPLICNSFVDFLACETAALLMLGALDEVNALTGGILELVLGPAFEPLAEALDGIIPGSDGSSPGLLGQILAILGVSGDEEEPPADEDCDDEVDECPEEDPAAAAFATAMADQPVEVQDAVTRLIGPAGDRISPSRQAALIPVLANLRAALGGPVDTSDPAQAAALVEVLDTIGEVLGSEGTDLPLDGLTDLLTAVDSLVGDLLEESVLGALGDVVDGLGIDSAEEVTDLLGDVVGALTGTRTRAMGLTGSYGPQAAELDAAIARLRS